MIFIGCICSCSVVPLVQWNEDKSEMVWFGMIELPESKIPLSLAVDYSGRLSVVLFSDTEGKSSLLVKRSTINDSISFETDEEMAAELLRSIPAYQVGSVDWESLAGDLFSDAALRHSVDELPEDEKKPKKKRKTKE